MKLPRLLLFALFFVSCKADRQQNSWQKLQLKGKVKAMSITEYKVSKQPFKEGEDSVITMVSYEFNNRGNIAIEINSQGSNHKKKCVYTFNEKGYPVQAIKYNEDGSFCYKAIFRYDETGNQIEQTQHDSKDSLGMRIVYSYDSAGNRVAETAYFSSGKLLNKYTHQYNNKRQETASGFYNADSLLVMRATYLYNDSGNKKEEHKYGEDDDKGWVVRYSYGSYDKHGNWLQRTTYAEDKPISIAKRTITYY